MAFPLFIKNAMIASLILLLVSPKVVESSSQSHLGRHGKGTPAPPPVDIHFGGRVSRAGKGAVQRPEFVKSTKCTSITSCQECENQDSCWHGSNPEGDEWGYLEINVPAGSSFTFFKAEVSTHCDGAKEGESKWYIQHVHDKDGNGKVSLHMDDEEIMEKVPDHYTVIPMTAHSQRLSVVFTPDDPTRESRGRVWLESYKSSPAVEICMSLKDCLMDLGDGSASSFKLRNVNRNQRKCLRQQMDGMTPEEVDVCVKWRMCVVNAGNNDKLLALLDAGVTAEADESDLSEDVSRVECIDPSVADPESWDCECAEGMEQRCEEADYEGVPRACCFQDLMCRSPKICSTWKNTHCACPNGPTSSCQMKENCKATMLQFDFNNSTFSMTSFQTKHEMRHAGINSHIQHSSIETKQQIPRKNMVRRSAKALKADRSAIEDESTKGRLARKMLANRAIIVEAGGSSLTDEGENQEMTGDHKQNNTGSTARSLDSSAVEKCT